MESLETLVPYSDIEGAGGGGKDSGSSRNPTEAPNDLFSVAFAKTLYLLSEGEIQGFPTSAERDILLDGTPIVRQDGTSNFSKTTQIPVTRPDGSTYYATVTPNFQNISLAYTTGTSTQQPLTGFTQIENTVNVSTTVIKDLGPITRTIVDPDIERCRVIIQHPALQSINASNGDTNGTTVQYKISVSSNGGPFIPQGGDANGVITVSGKSSGQFQRAYEFDLPVGGAPWQVRVERLTDDSRSGLLTDSFIWQAFVEITDQKLTYPNSALLGIRVDARQFNTIPDVKVRLRGRKVQVPTNYDPITRTYSGTWNGTWKQAWTDNPAWIFRDLVVNPVFGVRHYLLSADVDPWYLYSVARYCDELVSDGQGGTEPRFRCNVYLQNEGNVFEVLNSLASCFRGMLHYAEGKIFVTQDRPATPVQQFSEANVIQEVDQNGHVTTPSFVYQGTSRTARKSVVLASWDDPDQYYNNVTEYLQDDELLKRFGYLPTDLRLLGVTSRGQALRAAKFVLFSNRYLTTKVSFRIGAEGLASGIGDIIQIADPLRQGQRLGGRVKAISGNTITLDDNLTLSQGTTYTLTLAVPAGQTTVNGDGTTETKPLLLERTVSSFSKSAEGYTTVSLAGASLPTIQPGALWVLEWQDAQAALYRIVSISETSPMQFQIEAVQYNASSYGYIDNDRPIAIPKDRFTFQVVDPPTSVTAQLTYRNGRVQVAANWYAPTVSAVDNIFVNEYRYQWRQVGNETWSLPLVDTLYTEGQISLPQYTYGQQFQFRVASRNRLGQQSSWIQIDVAALPPPADVTGFTSTVDPLVGWTLAWDITTDLTVRYEVRRGESWGSGTLVTQKTSGNHLLGVLPVGTYTYWIKALDVPNNYSTNAVSTTITVTPLTAPTISGAVVDPNAVLTWVPGSGSYAAVEYEIRYGVSYESGAVLGRVKGTTFRVAANWSGSRTFWVAGIDTAGTTGSAGSTTVTITGAPAPPITGTFTNSRLELHWTEVSGSLATVGYEVRQGTTYATATVLTTVQSTSYLITANWSGSQTFWVTALDANGTKGTSASYVATINGAPAPSISTTFAGQNVTLTWGGVNGSLPTARYEIRRGNTLQASTLVAAIQGTAYTTKVDWGGTARFWVAAIDLHDNYGTFGMASAVVAVPSQPTITQQVIDNNVLLRWTDATATLPIQSYEVRRGSTWAGATAVGTKQGLFTVLFETTSGSYTYWIAGIDTAGNYGTPASIVATVNQPPDYVLKLNYDSAFSGTKNNLLTTASGLLGCLDATETWQSHFTSRGWSTPQDQINAGYTYYVMPSQVSGYYEEVIDYGAALSGSKVTTALARTNIAGSTTITPKISVSANGSSYTDYPGLDTVYATNFRYIKVRYDFSSAGGDDLLLLTGLNVRLDSKLKTDSGTGTANSGDAGGTTVNFNVAFVDVDSITVTPSGTSATFAVYDFVDAPNPTSFKVLLYNTSGNRVNGSFSWSARGF